MLIVNRKNQVVIENEFHCHDALIERFEYDFHSHELTVVFSESPCSNVRKVVFKEVFSYVVTGFEPWGHDDSCILSWERVDSNATDAHWEEIFKRTDALHDIDLHDLIITKFLISNGDVIRIACHSIIVNDL